MICINFKAQSQDCNPPEYKPENAPEELKALRQWVCWRWAWVEKRQKWTKVPVNPHTGGKAKTNDSRTWSSFEHAVAAWRASRSVAGVGFVFTAEDPYTGIDHDGCIRDGELDPWVAERLGGYVEVSPSGTGVKCIMRGIPPTGKRSRYASGRKVEVYDRGRFFTVTGWVPDGGSSAPTGEQEAIDQLCRELAPAPRKESGSKGGRATSVEGPPIPEGERHKTIRSILGRLHNGSRSLADLVAVAEKVNAERCTPPIGSPGDDPYSDLEQEARWVYGKTPCRKSKPPELEAMCDRLGQLWYEVERMGLGGKGAVRLYRYLIREARTIGCVVEGEGVGVARSLREASEELGCHLNTVLNSKHRLEEAGYIRYDRSSCRGSDSATFVLLTNTPPSGSVPHLSQARRNCDTTELGCAVLGDGVTISSRPGADELATAHHAHRGWVGYSREDTLCHVEAHPGLTREALADLLGWSRPRDLEHRHLRRLQWLGLLEEHEGRWWTPDSYAERQERVWEMSYSTVQFRSARRWLPEEGRWLHYVAETGCVANQNQRTDEARGRNEAQRRAFRRRLDELRRQVEDECLNGVAAPDDPAFDELDPVDNCRRPEGVGWRLYREKGYWSWVNADTGELKEIA